MTEANSTSFNNFFGNANRFGLNVHVKSGSPRESVKEFTKTVQKEVEQISNPFLNFLEKNEDVFNGKVAEQIIKTQTQMFNTSIILGDADEKVNGKAPKFNAMF